MDRRTDYSQIAATYDRRYEENQYPGIERALVEFAGADPAAHLLEVGCGTGYWLSRLSAMSRIVVGLDASPEMLAKARGRVPNVDLVCGHAEHLPWPEASFDRLYCINAFHHFGDKPGFLAEARRVLRPGGALMTVGLDPHQGADRWFVYDYFDGALETDCRRFPPAAAIRDGMRQVGFVSSETHVVEHLRIRVAAREALEKRRVDKTVTSQLSVLTDEEYRCGIERIRADIEAAESRGQDLILSLDLRLYGTFGFVEGAASREGKP